MTEVKVIGFDYYPTVNTEAGVMRCQEVDADNYSIYRIEDPQSSLDARPSVWLLDIPIDPPGDSGPAQAKAAGIVELLALADGLQYAGKNFQNAFMPAPPERRKSVVLIEVEGGVVQRVSYPHAVSVVIHDHDAPEAVPCVWCGTAMEQATSNRCPSCGNPSIPQPFSAVEIGVQFLCINGGRWLRMDVDSCECVESDSAFQEGDVASFNDDETVFPY